MMTWLSEKITSKKLLFKQILIWAAIFAIAAHGFQFFNLNLSHDYMNEFYTLNAGAWKISIGRFLAPTINIIFGQYTVLPWVSGMIMIGAIAFSLYLIAQMFKIEKRWQIILIVGLCTTSLVFVALLASFMQDLATDMVGLALATLCAYEWYKLGDEFKLRLFIISLIVLVLSLGCYQGFLPVVICLMIIKCIENILKKQELKTVIRHGLIGISIVAGGMVIYYAVANLVGVLTGYSLASNTTNSLSNVWDSNQSLFKRAVWAYIYTLWGLFAPSFAAVPARENLSRLSETSWQSYALSVTNIAIFIFCVVLLIRYLKTKEVRTTAKVLVVLLLLILPFAMNAMHFLSGASHTLMYYAFVTFYLLFFVFVNNFRMNNKIVYGLSVLLGISIIINVSVANALYAKKGLEAQSTAATVTRVLARIEEREDYVLGETKICMIGASDVQSGVRDYNKISSLFGADYNSSITYQASTEAYLHTVLQYNAKLCSNAEISKIIETKEFKEMEIFPAKESIRKLDDIVVVKMSDSVRW